MADCNCSMVDLECTHACPPPVSPCPGLENCILICTDFIVYCPLKPNCPGASSQECLEDFESRTKARPKRPGE